jgi:hypothetical protein
MDNYMVDGAYPREGTHTVEISLQWSDYKGTIICKIGGNTMGASIIQEVISSLENGDFEPDMSFEQNRRHVVHEDVGPWFESCYKLYNDSGDELQIDFDDIADCIIGVQIVGWEAID